MHPRGATKAPSRAEQEGRDKPYVHKKYPSTRYHPDGQSVTVVDEASDLALGKPWRDTPYPKVEPVPAPTAAQIEEELKAKVAMFDQSWAELSDKHNRLMDLLAERDATIAELRKQLQLLSSNNAQPPTETVETSAVVSKSEAKRQATKS